MGKRCGFKTLLVLTGNTSEEGLKSLTNAHESGSVESREFVPDYYIDSLADLSAYL